MRFQEYGDGSFSFINTFYVSTIFVSSFQLQSYYCQPSLLLAFFSSSLERATFDFEQQRVQGFGTFKA